MRPDEVSTQLLSKKAGDSVRKTLLKKSLLAVLILFLVACCTVAVASTEYELKPCSGKISIDENSYIVLTPDNLADHPDLVKNLEKTKDEILADWETRGVQLQAWTKKMDACLEVVLVQDEESQQFFDLERQTRQVRNDYLNLHRLSNKKYIQDGYTFTNLKWKKQKLGGNFLTFEYKRLTDAGLCRGLMRKTVRNGWTIILDYQVFNRLPRKTDENNLNKIANTVQFEVVEPEPVDTAPSSSAEDAEGTPVQTVVNGTASGLLKVTVPPPAETNVDTFTIEGQTTPGAHLIGVAMRWSSATPLKFTADATKAGNFKLKITLPDEGVWLVTLNLEVNGAIVAEEVFDTTTFSRTTLPVTLAAEVPEKLTSNEFVLSGVTSKGVEIQCIVTNTAAPDHPFNDACKTNGTGKFKFKIPTAAEGTYDFTLVFSKKGYNTKRLNWTAVRSLTEQEIQAQSTTKAIHPGYATLNKKLESYIGQTMVYKAYIVEVKQNGDDWIITAALKKNKKGYSDFLIFETSKDPVLMADAQVKIYGVCIGSYPIQSEEGDTSYPRFEYLYAE